MATKHPPNSQGSHTVQGLVPHRDAPFKCLRANQNFLIQRQGISFQWGILPIRATARHFFFLLWSGSSSSNLQRKVDGLVPILSLSLLSLSYSSTSFLQCSYAKSLKSVQDGYGRCPGRRSRYVPFSCHVRQDLMRSLLLHDFAQALTMVASLQPSTSLAESARPKLSASAKRSSIPQSSSSQ